MAPTSTGKLKEKQEKNWRAFSSQGILIKLEKSGNFTQNTAKIKKF